MKEVHTQHFIVILSMYTIWTIISTIVYTIPLAKLVPNTISLDETKNLLQFCEKEDFSVNDYDIALVLICDVNSQYDWKVHILYNQCLNGTFPWRTCSVKAI